MTTDDELATELEAGIRRALPVDLQLVAAERDEPVGADIGIKLLSAGLLDVAVAEDRGGLGLAVPGIAQLCAAAGRSLLPATYLHQALIVAPLLAGSDRAVATGLLGAVAAGGLTAGAGGSTDHAALRRSDAGVEISGVWVWLAPDAELVGIVAPALAAVLPLAGLNALRVNAIDPGQGLHEITGIVSNDELLAVADGETAFRLWQLWRLGLCAQTLGCVEEMMSRSTEYAKGREQFGRPIGSFQAVGHILADMYVGTTAALSAVVRAAALLEADDPLAEDVMSAIVHWVPARTRRVCEQAIQVHGGNGFTWEYGLHLYYRRVLASQAALGGHHQSAARASEALSARVHRHQSTDVA